MTVFYLYRLKKRDNNFLFSDWDDLKDYLTDKGICGFSIINIELCSNYLCFILDREFEERIFFSFDFRPFIVEFIRTIEVTRNSTLAYWWPLKFNSIFGNNKPHRLREYSIDLYEKLKKFGFL